ncbi:MAG: YajQ family cyclic di-GMP-binding protein [Acidobacteria bacterium]|nr:YajQ family cyclic di-GMP-binding protein [Acidobacteriota bacterium]
MASENSFDIVSKIDLQEVDNAVQQALKEIRQRYDFKGSIADIRRDKEIVQLTADDEYKLTAVTEILMQKLAARRVPAKGLSFKPPEQATGGSLRQQVALQQGIPQDQAKEIVKILKVSGLKVQAAIQADQVRVKGRNKDDLQGAIKVLRDSALNIDMQFTNYR